MLFERILFDLLWLFLIIFTFLTASIFNKKKGE